MSTERSPLLPASAVVEDYSGNPEDAPVVRDVEQQPEEPKKSYLLLILPMALGILLMAMDGTIVVSSYAKIGSDFNELQNTSWIATSYLLSLTAFQPLTGKLSDIFGRKRCLIFSYSIFAIGCLLCGMSRNMKELVASRGLQGIGGAGMQTIVSIIVSDLVPLRSRGTWQGLLNIVWTSGNALGASLGGYIADTIGWRWSFLLQFPMSIVAIVAVSLLLRLPETQTGDFKTNIKRVDFGGAVTLVLAVYFLLFGLDRGGNLTWNDRWTIGSLIAFAIFGVAFGFVEMKFAREPFAPRRIIANRALIASYLVNFFGIASGFSILFYVPLYLQATLGKTATETSLWLIMSIVGSLVGSLGGGLIMQATGKYYILTVVAYIFLFIGSTTVGLTAGFIVRSIIGISIGLILSSLGNGTGITTSLISLIANAGPEDQAIATAVSYLFRSLGSVVGLSIGSTIIQITLRTSLRRALSGQDVDEIILRVRESLSYIDRLDAPTQAIVRSSYEKAAQSTFWFSVIMGACALLSSLFIKEVPLVNRK